jgi:hypothetical protein
VFMPSMSATTFPEAPMKSYQWLFLIAALLITICEVVVFTASRASPRSSQPAAPRSRAAAAAPTRPAGEP